MENINKMDVVIIGATGFSGMYIVKMLARLNCGIKWGIAGRSADKLKSLTTMLKDLGEDTSKLPTFICNANDKSSLIDVCKRTKLIINCIGPYMETGHAVVEACIECGAHYIDITVEMNFILDLTKKYHQLAEEANVLIIPACGLVAVISIMGLMYLEDNFTGTLKSVELYQDIVLPKEMLYPNSKSCFLHSGSWNTILQRIQNMDECENLAKEMLPDIEEPAEIKRSYIHYRNGKIWVPYFFPDEAIVKMTEKYLNEIEGKRYIPFKMYGSCSFSLFFLIAIPFVFIFYIFINFGWFRKLVTLYPGFFTFGYMTHEGPVEEIRKKLKCNMIYEGKGWSKDVEDFGLPANKSMKMKVIGHDGYQTTADAVIASALTLLQDSSKMPRGGVISCGVAFRRTSIVHRLRKFGINYEIID